jgi:hypothetical protein
MLEATLLRAVEVAREKIATADRKAAGWLAERDRRRRQLAAFLRGIVRLTGSQHKAAAVTGMGQSVISRLLDAEGHKKQRQSMSDVRNRDLTSAQIRADVTNQNVTSPADDNGETVVVKTNVVNLRRRRPDWKPREPRRSTLHKWYQEYLGWTESAQKTARQFIFNAKGLLPEEAYYDTRPSNSNSTVGPQKRPSARTPRTRVGNLSAS